MGAPKNNKFALNNNGGRPPIYDNPEDLIEKIIDYFEHIKGEVDAEEEFILTGEGVKVTNYTRHPEEPTITGLALHLGFACKTSLHDYRKKKEFSYPIKRAISIIEQSYEKGLREKNFGGSIFALKNMGWADKIENVNTNLNTEVDFDPSDCSEDELKTLENLLSKCSKKDKDEQ